MRPTVLALCALLAVVAVPQLAVGQPAPPTGEQAPPPEAPPAGAPAPGAADVARDHGPAVPGALGSKAAATLFWALALLSVLGSIFVITRRNLVAAVIGMVGTFFAVAALYAMLYAHFLAAIQVLVYAGAIMVLFVFVIMILNRPEDEPFALQGLFGKGLAGLALGYLLFRVGEVLWGVRNMTPARLAAPGEVIDGSDFGATQAIGSVLFEDYLFPFEAVSVVLLVAVVGALAIARPWHGGNGGDADAGAQS
jgi:NADH-quinone oxidoreductase subunit J